MPLHSPEVLEYAAKHNYEVLMDEAAFRMIGLGMDRLRNLSPSVLGVWVTVLNQ
jgi:hypothetical protein